VAGESEAIDDEDDVLDSAMDDAASAAGDAGEPGGSAAASFQFRDALRSRNYDVPDDVDDDAFLSQIEQWSSRAAVIPQDVEPDKLPTMLQAAREFEQHRSEFEKWRASQQQAVQQPQQPVQQQQPSLSPAGREAQAAKAAGYTAADIAEAKQFCSFDNQTGMWVPKHPFHGEAAKALNEVAMRAQRHMEEFGIDPDGFVEKRAVSAVEKRVQQLLEERLGSIMPDIEAFRQFQTQNIQQQFLAPIASELYVLDASGSVTGKTAKGEVFERAYAEAPRGLSEHQKLEYARNAADAWLMRNPPQQQKPGSFLLKKAAAPAQAAKAPEATGKNSDDKQPSGQPEGRRQRFVDRLRKRGEDGRFLSRDQSGTVRASQQNGQGQTARRQTAREIYQALKSGEIPLDE
jgi:hypothetical protein